MESSSDFNPTPEAQLTPEVQVVLDYVRENERDGDVQFSGELPAGAREALEAAGYRVSSPIADRQEESGSVTVISRATEGRE